MTAEAERFRRWHDPWQERVCDGVRRFADGTALRARSCPDFWAYNCVRLERPLTAPEMVAVADRELAGCAHRFVEWMVPMPDTVVSELRAQQWLATPLVYLRHDGRAVTQAGPEVVELDYDAVRPLRDIWHREDFGEHVETEAYHAQARAVAALADARVLAALSDGRPIGFAQVETHDGGSEVSEVFVHPDHRGRGFGSALTRRAIAVAADAAPEVWICAERDGRPRRLYERLGFRVVVETGAAIRLPSG